MNLNEAVLKIALKHTCTNSYQHFFYFQNDDKKVQNYVIYQFFKKTTENVMYKGRPISQNPTARVVLYIRRLYMFCTVYRGFLYVSYTAGFAARPSFKFMHYVFIFTVEI